VWWDWPEPWRRPGDADLAALRREPEAELGLYEYIQWIADTQLRECRVRAQSHGLAVGLYLDVAVGVDAGGADAWSEPEAVLASLSVGAPPDVMNSAGQNWGLAGFNPAGLEARRFAPFRAMLRSVMRHAGAIRIDHVLGLKRLFLIPHGMSAQDGAYVRLPFDALLAVIAQESVRQRCIVIGEDLGTVPEGFRDTMWDWGLWSYLVLLFERGWDGAFRRPEHFNHDALVTFSTHDLPTFAGWRSNHDLEVKRGLGIDPGESHEQRGHAINAMRQALGHSALPREHADAPAGRIDGRRHRRRRPAERARHGRRAPELAPPAATAARGPVPPPAAPPGCRGHCLGRTRRSRNHAPPAVISFAYPAPVNLLPVL
jgi:4-alpha-glucanotransferase